VLRRYSVILTCILSLAALAAAQQARPANLDTIVRRMERAAEANRAHYHPYTITRDYQFFGSNPGKPAAEVTAEISFVPPATKEFRILTAEGNSHGETVVRHMLQDERTATQAGTAPGAIARTNYDFVYLGEGALNGSACYILGLSPKRKEKSLVVGRAWVDQQSYLVRRIDGDMSQLPSWWLKSVHVTLDFGPMDGMWIERGTRAVAEVRIFGTKVLNARAVKFESGVTEASRRPARRSRANYTLGSVVH
jgi:hypothetical protein